MDLPNERSSHARPTPKGGGVGILLAFLLGAWAGGVSPFLWGPATVLAVVGLVGDRVDLAPRIRLMVQFAGAFVTLGGWWLARGSDPRELAMLAPAAVFLVGTANYYNFMDGINGIAGITGTVGFALLGGQNAAAGGAPGTTLLAFGLACACLGFLPWNFPRARVFLGDVGSILLGYVFAAMVLWQSRDLTSFLAGTACLFPFYADEWATLTVRIRDRQSLLKAHRRHLYQLLVNEGGLAHWKVSLGYGTVQLAVGLAALWVSRQGLAVLAGFLFVCLLAWFGADRAGRRKHEAVNKN